VVLRSRSGASGEAAEVGVGESGAVLEAVAQEAVDADVGGPDEGNGQWEEEEESGGEEERGGVGVDGVVGGGAGVVRSGSCQDSRSSSWTSLTLSCVASKRSR
jgi:hypothetical protein